MAHEEEVAVVVVPLPAQGHLNQFLHLARLISARGVPVHYVGSATHVCQAKDRVHGWDLTTAQNIHFHHLPLPSFPTPPPNPYSITKFPAHLLPAFEAALQLEAPLASLLQSLSSSSRRVVVVHDSLMSFAANIAARLPKMESYAFHTISAFASLLFQWESRGKPPEPWIRNLNLSEVSFEGCFTEEFLQFVRCQHKMAAADAGRLFNTCRGIEGEFVDLHARDPKWQGQKLFAVGPLNPVALETSEGVLRRNECVEWLDRQPPASVLYVSFGTTSSMSNEQIEELAAGLESSKQRFIWVLRDADRGDIYADDHKTQREILSSDYEKSLEGMGMIVRGWAPQLEILAHPSTGGFMSHCGWNSCMESMSIGVPMLAWPMHSDQPRNTLLVTKFLKVGIAAQDWAERGAILPSTVVRDAILRLMVGEEGKEVRKNAALVGELIREAISEDGASQTELDSFIAHITRLSKFNASEQVLIHSLSFLDQEHKTNIMNKTYNQD